MRSSRIAFSRRKPRPVESVAPVSADATLALQKDNIAQLAEISRNSQTTFMALILACVYSYLTIATTTDAALLSNSNATPLPIIQVNVPIVWFYYFAPVILTVLFVYFHLYLERFWRCVARLPLRHPDGRGLDDYVYPWLISCAFIRGEIRQLSAAHRWSVRLEAWLSLLLGWGLVPIVLLFYWGRYVAAHDRWGTLLHVALVLLSVGFALRYQFTARNALHQMALNAQAGADAGAPARPGLRLRRAQRLALGAAMSVLAGALVYLSLAAVGSLPESDCEGVGADSGCALYQPGRAVWQAVGIEPYSEVDESRFVAKPANWQELLADPPRLRNYLDGQRALVLVGRDLRGMSAREAFLPGSRLSAGSLDFADLRHAVLTASRLEGVSLQGAKLTDVELRHAVIVDSRFDEVSAEAARFGQASFAASGSGGRTRFSGDFSSASFEAARGDGLLFRTRDGVRNPTSLREAVLSRVSFRWAEFQRVDLGGARIEEATLTHSQFTDVDFSGAALRHSFLNFSVFTRCRFIGADIEDSFFVEARFVDSELAGGPRAAPTPGRQDDAPPAQKRIAGFQAVLAVFDGKTVIRDLHFERAELRGARFEGTRLENLRFSNSDLSGAVFEAVDLAGVEFAGVDLSGADLSSARRLALRQLAQSCGNDATRLPSGLSIAPCRTSPP